MTNHASRMVMRRFEDRLRPLGFSMAYLRVAVALDERGPLQQKDLLEHVPIEQPTLAALLTRMERDRLLALVVKNLTLESVERSEEAKFRR